MINNVFGKKKKQCRHYVNIKEKSISKIAKSVEKKQTRYRYQNELLRFVKYNLLKNFNKMN